MGSKSSEEEKDFDRNNIINPEACSLNPEVLNQEPSTYQQEPRNPLAFVNQNRIT